MIRAVQVDACSRFFDESIAGTALAAPAARAVRSARARRSGLGRRSRPQAHVVRGARRRVRAPGDRGHDADDARAHGHRAPERRAADAGARRERTREALRRFPDLDLSLEMMLRRMVGLLLIESRRSTRSRGPKRCSPTPISSPATATAADSSATSAPTRRRTSSTCAPRSPRCATARSSASRGAAIAGTEVIGTLWDAALELSLGANRDELRAHRDRPRSSTRSTAIPAATRSSKASMRSRRTEPGRTRLHEVRHLLRAPAPAAVGRRTPSTS